jgi:transcriptional regulator with PAS, ATPase and Fis domain
VAPTRSTVLITGESGTGKEQVARALHVNSPRARGRFVAFNVMAIPEHLLESELFGHVRGAFTGAYVSRRGLLVEAHGGTLFMDEVGDLPLPLQAKLLRVLQEHRFRPVGGDTEVEVDLRLVLATHRDLEEMVREGRFREDLYYRLNVITVHLPPLRERGEDILSLTDHFLRKFATELGRPPQRFSQEALDLLRGYSWPGNVRELEHVVERAVALTHHQVITPDCLPPRLRSNGDALSPESRLSTVDEVLWVHVQRVLREVRGNQTKAAAVLGISRRTLHRWLKAGSTHFAS